MMRFSAVALLATLLCAGSASAKSLLSDMPGPLGTVQIFHTFANPAHANKIRVGEDVEVVFTVRNLQASKMNVTYVAGSINSPTNFQQHFQNFTTAAYKSLVDGSSDRSYTYTFRPDARLPPRAFYLALTVFYHEAGTRKSMQSDTFFNQTVELIDQDRIIDTESFSLYITLAIILAAAGNGIYMLIKDVPAFKSLTKKSKKGKVATQTTAAPSDKSDFLVGTSLHLEKVKKDKAQAKKAK